MPILSPEFLLSERLPDSTLHEITRVYSDFGEVVEPPRQGFTLTLKINFAKLPQRKEDYLKAITEIASLQAVLLTSQLKYMLWNLGSQDINYAMYKPIKLVYHPREPFFVIRQPEKLTAIFPMRFKDNSDVVLATSFFQELTEAGNSLACAKAPRCTWSPIPPPELRGEAFQYLTTNGGFVSFDILSHHVKGTRADKTVWNLLNFDSYVKYHIKSTKGFIQRKMGQRMESLDELIQNAKTRRDDTKKPQSSKCVKKLIRFPKSVAFRRKCGLITNRIKRSYWRIRIKGLDRFRARWFRVPTFTYFTKYTKLD